MPTSRGKHFAFASPANPLRRSPPHASLIGVSVALGIVVLSFLCHLPLRHAELSWFDRETLAAESETGPRTFRPVWRLSLALERRLTPEPSPLASRAVNLTLHAVASFLLFALARSLGAAAFAAIAAAMLFAAHPLHVEAVALVDGRAALLCAFFGFLALIAQAVSVKRSPPARAASWLSGLFLFLALGSSESGIGVVAVLLLVALRISARPDQMNPRRWLRERGSALAPPLAACALYAVFRWWSAAVCFGSAPIDPTRNPLVLLHGSDQLVTALGLLARFFRLLVYPIGLTVDYSGGRIPAETHLFAPWPAAGLLLLVVGLLLAAHPWPLRSTRARGASARPAPPEAIAAALVLFPYLVSGNLFLLDHAIFAERSLYLPTAGFCLLAGSLLHRMRESYPAFRHWSPVQRSRLIRAIAALLVAAFALLTWQRCIEWRNDESLALAAIRVYPQAPLSRLALARLRAGQGRFDEALRHLDTSLAAWPRHAGTWEERGRLLRQLGEHAAAADSLRRAIDLGATGLTDELEEIERETDPDRLN
jgi:hypothetical protein